MLVENLCLVSGVLSRGVGVERAAEGLERQRQISGTPRRSALEHHALQHMGDAHLVGAFMRRSRAHPGPESDRPYSRHVFREYGQSVRENGTSQVRRGGLRCEGHSRERPPSLPRDPPRPRRGLSPRSPRSEPSLRSSPPSAWLSAPTAAKAGDSLLPSSRFPLPSSPSGFGTSAFIDSRSLPRSSRSSSLTFTRSPFLTTSSVFSVRPCLSSERCTRPSVPGMISTNAPKAVVLFTVPSYVSPITGSAVRA